MRLVCPHCETTLRLSDRPEDDTVIKCPKCKKPFLASTPDDEDEGDDDRPARKKKAKKKKGPMKVPVAAVVGVGVAVLAVVAVVVVLVVGERKKPAVAKEEPQQQNTDLPPVQPAQPSELRTRITELFRTNDVQPTRLPALPSLETEADDPVVPTFSSLKPRRPDPKGGKGIDPDKVIEEVSKSTVFIKVIGGASGISALGAITGNTGSGFVIRTEGTTALVATNHHVIRRALEGGGGSVKLTVVFDSGNPATEQERPATVIAHDEDADLAILRVAGLKRVPPIIDPMAAPNPTPTMEVLICGFPLAGAEVIAGHSPNISIGKGAVSSIKRTRSGEMDKVQVDGVLNPGNSGGPIVERSTGRLIGVAVLTVRPGVGQGVGWAVPVPKLVALVDGRVEPPIFTGSAVDRGEAAFQVEVPVADPFNKVKSVALHVNPSGPAPEKVKDPATGWKLMGGAQKIELTYTPGKGASGQLRLPVSGKTVSEVAVQLACTDAEGTTAVSPPVTYNLNPAGLQPAGETVPLADLTTTPGRYAGQTIVVRGKMTPVIDAISDVYELTVSNESNVAPPNLQFLAGTEIANQLRHMPQTADIRLSVQLTCRVGKPAPNGLGKTLVRVTRIDFLSRGNKVSFTIPSDRPPPDDRP